MARAIAIVGASGSGKTFSIAPNKTLNIKGLPSKEVFFLSIQKDELPFRGWAKKYTAVTKDNPQGNFFKSDNPEMIYKVMKSVSDKRPDIKYLVIDDFQYVMANEFFRSASEKGFEKFTRIGEFAFRVLNDAQALRSDLTVIFTMHEEEYTKEGESYLRIKSLGKMIQEKYTIEGVFNIVLWAKKGIDENGRAIRYFVHNDPYSTCKAPAGMFEEDVIPNDMGFVLDKITEYDNAEDDEE